MTENETKKNKFHLFKYLRPYRKETIIACTAIILECGLEISIPFLMNLLLDHGMDSYVENGETLYTMNLTYTLIIGGVMILFALLALGLGILTAKYAAKAGRGLGYELRKEEYLKIQSYSFANLNEYQTNSLITRMTNDVQVISDAFCQSIRPLLRSPVQLVCALAFAITMSVELSAVFAVVIPIMAIIFGVMVVLARPRFVKVQASLDRVNTTTRESVVAMKLIRSNAKKDYEIQKFGKVNDNVKDVSVKSFGLIAYNGGLMRLMTSICTFSILLIGGQLSLSRQSADLINDMASFLSYVSQTLASINMLSNVFMTISRSEASTTRLAQVFASESEIVDNKDSKLKVENGDISFNHVSFAYDHIETNSVVKDVTFDIEDGEFVGLLGQTGSSKSTLVYLMERFYDADSGEIDIGGHNIKDYSLKELRSSTAIAFQNSQLFTGTIRDNLRWGKKDATEEEMREACRIACCLDFIENKLPDGFDTVLGQTGSNVSGGQRQRICIARAIIREPKILVLDDSFSALDRVTEGELKKNLKDSLPHMTKIVISQKVSTIMDADRIIVMNDGKINSIGTNDTLLESDEIYQDIYRLQTEDGSCLRS